MTIKLKPVPAAVGGGRQEYHTEPMQNGVLTKHAGKGGYKTIGSAERTSDSGQKADLVRSSRARRK